MTLEQAIDELNRRKWRGRNDWFSPHPLTPYITSAALYKDELVRIAPVDAIAIAEGLLAQDELTKTQERIAELEAEAEQLKARADGLCSEHNDRCHDYAVQLEQRYAKLRAAVRRL